MNRTPPHAPGDETVTLDISVTPLQTDLTDYLYLEKLLR